MADNDQFLGELRVFSFTFAPKGWAQCNGQLLPLLQNQALFALLGTTFGGDGRTTFALPDLRGSTPIHQAPGLAPGARGGETAHTLTLSELPAHQHLVTADQAQAATGNGGEPAANRVLAASTGASLYGSATTLASMATSAVSLTGGGEPHDNMSPYLVLNVCIALTGIFPTRN